MTALYPTEMKRENIYGTHGTIGEDGTDFTPASNQTKIITTLNEARTSLGLKANGEIDTDKYPTSFPDAENYPVAIDGSTVYDATADNLFNSTVDGNKAISKNCIIKGQPNQDIYVKTDGKTIYILLDNVKLDCHKIVVDHVVDSNGAIADGDVVFIIKGTLDVINNGSGIVTKEFINLPGYDYTKDWGIIYYAENSGSTKPVITVKNGEGTMVGCFRTPTAIFAQFGNGGFWEKEYTGEDGQTVKDKPVIVGNALFDKVYGQNNIINHYTATGGGGGSSSSGMKTIVTDVGFFEIQYMLGG